MFQVKFRIGTGSQSQVVSTLLRNLGDAKPLLRRWAGFFRKKAKDRFNELSGPALAASTLKKYAATGVGAITSAGKVRMSFARNLESAIRKKYRTGPKGALSETGQTALAELRSLISGASPSASGSQDKSIQRLQKRLQSVGKRRSRRGKRREGQEQVDLQVVSEGRKNRVRVVTPGYRSDLNVAFPVAARQLGAKYSIPKEALKEVSGTHYRVSASAVTGGIGRRKSDGHRLLGRLRGSLVSAVSDRVSRLINRVPWSGAHNEGATVGHGAGLPQRLTVEVTAEDARELAKIALEQATGTGRTK